MLSAADIPEYALRALKVLPKCSFRSEIRRVVPWTLVPPTLLVGTHSLHPSDLGPLADFEALLADTDFVSEGPSSFFLESDSLRSNSSLSVPYSDIFFFPFSFPVSHLLGFLRGDCTTESALLAGSSSN